MSRFLLAVLVSTLACGTAWSQGDRGAEILARYHAAAAAKDHAALVKLWRENPEATLGTIDSDLEGSLALFEKAPEAPDTPAIEAMKARAIQGAIAADEAFATQIFSDYASSFAGFDAAERKDFRAGQKAVGEAGAALRKKDHQTALEAADRAVALTWRLGDWWGYAMGLTARGRALEGLGKDEDALAAQALARRINGDLRLAGPALANGVACARLATKLGHLRRADAFRRASAEAALAQKNDKALLELAEIEKRLAPSRPASAESKPTGEKSK